MAYLTTRAASLIQRLADFECLLQILQYRHDCIVGGSEGLDLTSGPGALLNQVKTQLRRVCPEHPQGRHDAIPASSYLLNWASSNRFQRCNIDIFEFARNTGIVINGLEILISLRLAYR